MFSVVGVFVESLLMTKSVKNKGCVTKTMKTPGTHILMYFGFAVLVGFNVLIVFPVWRGESVWAAQSQNFTQSKTFDHT